jgi:hypothetical protein
VPRQNQIASGGSTSSKNAAISSRVAAWEVVDHHRSVSDVPKKRPQAIRRDGSPRGDDASSFWKIIERIQKRVQLCL